MRVTPPNIAIYCTWCFCTLKTPLFTALGASERSKHRYLPQLVLLSAQNRCSSPLGGLMSAQNCCSSLLRSHRSAQNRCSSLLEGHKSASKPLLKPASRLRWRSKSPVEYYCSKLLFEDAGLCDTVLCWLLLLLYLPPCMDMHGFTLVYTYIYIYTSVNPCIYMHGVKRSSAKGGLS